MLASVIIIYAYWRVIRYMFSRVENVIEIDTNVISAKFILYACMASTILISVFADKIIYLCQLVAYYM